MSDSTPMTLASVKDRVNEQIKEKFAELLPPELFASLVEQATREFVEKDLKPMVKEILQAKAREAIKIELEKPEYVTQWNTTTGAQEPSEQVKKIVEEAAPILMSALMGNIVQGAVMNIQQNINGMYIPG